MEDNNCAICPICNKTIAHGKAEDHVNQCIEASERPTRSTQQKLSFSPNISRPKPSLGQQSVLIKKRKASTTNDLKSIGDDIKAPKVVIIQDEDSVKETKAAKLQGKVSIDIPSPAPADRTGIRTKEKSCPLAEKMRPQTLDEIIGQSSVVGEKCLITNLLKNNKIPSLIFWGPPGCGKTSIANVIANSCKSSKEYHFIRLSATTSNTNEVKEKIKLAQNEKSFSKRKTVIFLDEIHRFNKLQQDTFLPHIENGTIILVGATTENPSFHINNALLSRCKVITLQKLSNENLFTILMKGISQLGIILRSKTGSKTNDTDTNNITIDVDALKCIADLSDGDARTALTGLELTHQMSIDNSYKGNINITKDHVKCALESGSRCQYDRNGDEHYSIISAFHKSIRGGDDTATLYWLARMLEGGEKPLYIARRLVRFASEDIGLADPHALNLAVSAYQASHFIGMPECDIALAQAAVYMSRAPKSVEVYQAYSQAKHLVTTWKGAIPSVPLHLRNPSTKLMRDLGHGSGYKYNPNYNGDELVDQEYLPQELLDKKIDFFHNK